CGPGPPCRSCSHPCGSPCRPACRCPRAAGAEVAQGGVATAAELPAAATAARNGRREMNPAARFLRGAAPGARRPAAPGRGRECQATIIFPDQRQPDFPLLTACPCRWTTITFPDPWQRAAPLSRLLPLRRWLAPGAPSCPPAPPDACTPPAAPPARAVSCL